jgi:hypothetical protein
MVNSGRIMNRSAYRMFAPLNHGSNSAHTCMAAFGQATVPAITLVCENEAGILDVLFKALD